MSASEIYCHLLPRLTSPRVCPTYSYLLGFANR
jgi:hypothetical protein